MIWLVFLGVRGLRVMRLLRVLLAAQEEREEEQRIRLGGCRLGRRWLLVLLRRRVSWRRLHLSSRGHRRICWGCSRYSRVEGVVRSGSCYVAGNRYRTYLYHLQRVHKDSES